MKTKQKIILGFSFLAFGLIFAVGNPQKAFAAVVSEASFRDTLYRITAFENKRPKTITANIAGRQFTFTDSNTTDNDINLKTTNNNFFICEQTSKTTGITITGRATPIPGGGDSYAGFITLNYKDDTGERCNGNADEFLNRLSISAVYGSPVAPGTVAPAEEATTEDQCNETFWSFTWAFCPIISAIDGMFGELNEFIQEQLSYDIKKYFTADTKRTWSVIRTIATSVLVIIMLVMVFSQAINAGIFDAYTVRKLLPRLVVAAILIQVSYDLFIWVITLANNAGSGIYDLLAVPFGGQKALELDQLIGKLGGGGTAAATTLIPAMLGAGIVIFNPFGVLLFGFAVLLAVLVAAATLLIRNVLILACIILVPLALVAWILPGTNRYWKLWWDNFIKLLLLFPIIMAIIVVGRIFAYTVASSDSGIFVWLAVLVGFFGPYFLLPKAFRWGGSIMAEAGKQINGAGESFGKKPREFLKGRQEGYQAEKVRRSQERVNQGLDRFTRNPSTWMTAPIDKLRSGKLDPTLGLAGSRRRRNAVTAYEARGAASQEEDVKVADQKLGLLFAQVSDHDALARAYAEADSSYTYQTHDGQTHTLGDVSAAEQQAGLNAVAKYGGDRNFMAIDRIVDQLNQGTPQQRVLAKKFLDANANVLIPKMKHLYYGPDREQAIDSSLSSLSQASFSSMEGVEMEAILDSLTGRAAQGDQEAHNQLRRVLVTYESAINNENIHIGAGVNRAMEALIDGNNLNPDIVGNDAINLKRGRNNRPSILRDPQLLTNPELAPLFQRLGGRIDVTGNVRPQETAGAAQPRTAPSRSAGSEGSFGGPGQQTIVNIDHGVNTYHPSTGSSPAEGSNRDDDPDSGTPPTNNPTA